MTNSYASQPGSLGRFGERVVIPVFAEFVALAAFVHLLVAVAALVAALVSALVALAPGAFSL